MASITTKASQCSEDLTWLSYSRTRVSQVALKICSQVFFFSNIKYFKWRACRKNTTVRCSSQAMDMAFQCAVGHPKYLFISGNVFFMFWLLKFGITWGILAFLDSCICPNQWSVLLHSQQSSYLSTAFCNKQRLDTQVSLWRLICQRAQARPQVNLQLSWSLFEKARNLFFSYNSELFAWQIVCVYRNHLNQALTLNPSHESSKLSEVVLI